jgi:hypothetical protein
LAWAALALASLPFKLAGRRRSKGLPSLFRAKSGVPPLAKLRLALFFVAMALAAAGYARALAPPEVVRAEVEVPGLPAGLEGLTVALFSDLHYGRGANWAQAERVFELLRLYRPDLVVSAGDLVDKSPLFALDLGPLVSALSPPHGFWAVFGQGELAAGPPPELAAAFRDAGVIALSGSKASVPALPLDIAGFGDEAGPGPLDAAALGPGAQEGRLTMAVTRRPRPAAELEALGAGLCLTGPPEGLGLVGPDSADALYGPAGPGGARRAGTVAVLVATALSEPLPLRTGPRPRIGLYTLRRAPG